MVNSTGSGKGLRRGNISIAQGSLRCAGDLVDNQIGATTKKKREERKGPKWMRLVAGEGGERKN